MIIFDDCMRKGITAGMKLADLIDLDHNLLSVLSRMGVGLGFGEHTIDEACRLHGVNTWSFILVCDIYHFGDVRPSADGMALADVRDIVRYLHNSHVDYTTTSLKNLSRSLSAMMDSFDDKTRSTIERFFGEYEREVQNHFEYEERTVIPYVESVLAGSPEGGYSMETFRQNHSNIDEKLGDLKNLVMKYLPDTGDQSLRYDVLHQIYHLENDLAKHTSVEENVLIPMVKRLEDDMS